MTTRPSARRRRARTVALVVGLVVTALVPTTGVRAATDGARERVVRGTVAMPTGVQTSTAPRTLFRLPLNQTIPPAAGGGTLTVDPVGPMTVGVPAQSLHLACMTGPAAQGSVFVVDDVEPGRTFELTADAGPWNDDFDIAFYATPAGCDGDGFAEPLAHSNDAGDEHAVVPDDAALALVTLVRGSPGAAFTYRELAQSKVHFPQSGRRPTVVAVLEGPGLNPYHFDFLGHQHPWNTDEEPENGIAFDADPGTWLEGYPGSTPIALTLPGPNDADMAVAGLADRDASAWAEMKSSTPETPNLYRFPGTKVVGAIHFDEHSAITVPFYAGNEAHGTKVASVAIGNTHGTCPECVLVRVSSGANPLDLEAAIHWVAQQPWIDVVTNSWVHRAFVTTESLRHPYNTTRAAAESGQTWVWGAGNGYDNTFIAPNLTYAWNQHAADWIVLVGGVNDGDYPVGAGRPVDIASHVRNYPSAGGSKVGTSGSFAGTSNAAPVVAGTFAKVIQWGRDLLRDPTPGHRDGVVAQGRPLPCDGQVPTCPLADGVLDRAEVQALVFGNVKPLGVRPPKGTPHSAVNTWGEQVSAPPVLSYTDTGHGIVHGRSDPGRFVAEQRQFLDALRGAVPSYPRQPGEAGWMFADSKCRQKLWGGWTGGYYKHGAPDPEWDVATDLPAIALNAACSGLPTGIFGRPTVDFPPLPHHVCPGGDDAPSTTCVHSDWEVLKVIEDGLNRLLGTLMVEVPCARCLR